MTTPPSPPRLTFNRSILPVSPTPLIDTITSQVLSSDFTCAIPLSACVATTSPVAPNRHSSADSSGDARPHRPTHRRAVPPSCTSAAAQEVCRITVAIMPRCGSLRLSLTLPCTLAQVPPPVGNHSPGPLACNVSARTAHRGRMYQVACRSSSGFHPDAYMRQGCSLMAGSDGP